MDPKPPDQPSEAASIDTAHSLDPRTEPERITNPGEPASVVTPPFGSPNESIMPNDPIPTPTFRESLIPEPTPSPTPEVSAPTPEPLSTHDIASILDNDRNFQGKPIGSPTPTPTPFETPTPEASAPNTLDHITVEQGSSGVTIKSGILSNEEYNKNRIAAGLPPISGNSSESSQSTPPSSAEPTPTPTPEPERVPDEPLIPAPAQPFPAPEPPGATNLTDVNPNWTVPVPPEVHDAMANAKATGAYVPGPDDTQPIDMESVRRVMEARGIQPPQAPTAEPTSIQPPQTPAPVEAQAQQGQVEQPPTPQRSFWDKVFGRNKS